MMKLFSISKLFCICVFASCFVLNSAHSQTITETQALDFGTFAFASFNNALRINIRNNGTSNPNGNTIIIGPPTRGEYDLSGAPPNSSYSVTLPTTIDLTGPGGTTFLIDNFRVRPNNLVTDGSGFDSFRIAARITSQSGGVFYGNGVYTQNLTIIVTF